MLDTTPWTYRALGAAPSPKGSDSPGTLVLCPSETLNIGSCPPHLHDVPAVIPRGRSSHSIALSDEAQGSGRTSELIGQTSSRPHCFFFGGDTSRPQQLPLRATRGPTNKHYCTRTDGSMDPSHIGLGGSHVLKPTRETEHITLMVVNLSHHIPE